MSDRRAGGTAGDRQTREQLAIGALDVALGGELADAGLSAGGRGGRWGMLENGDRLLGPLHRGGQQRDELRLAARLRRPGCPRAGGVLMGDQAEAIEGVPGVGLFGSLDVDDATPTEKIVSGPEPVMYRRDPASCATALG